MMTIIEWQKDLTEPIGPTHPHLEHDTLNVYFVTSRDGIHVEHEWVYAHRPLLPKDGLTQSDWAAGIIFPSAQLMTREEEHRMYFEARRGDIHHEVRFGQPDEDDTVGAAARRNVAKIGTASWARDRIVGVRAADPAAVAILTTKWFRFRTGSLQLNVDVPSDTCGSLITVEVLRAGDSDGGEPGSVAPVWLARLEDRTSAQLRGSMPQSVK